MILWNPQPNMDVMGKTNPESWEEFRSMLYEGAIEEDVALLDLGGAWGGFSHGQSLGLFADGVHPNDSGSLDLSTLVEKAILS